MPTCRSGRTHDPAHMLHDDPYDLLGHAQPTLPTSCPHHPHTQRLQDDLYELLDETQAAFSHLVIANTRRTALLCRCPQQLSYVALEILRDQVCDMTNGGGCI
eukprot:170356-Chlamydomonas_euryale.AAC.1